MPFHTIEGLSCSFTHAFRLCVRYICAVTGMFAKITIVTIGAIRVNLKTKILLLQVMIQPHNRHASFSLYIAALALSDTVVLSAGM